MLQRLVFGLFTLCALTLTGCALSPQQLDPNPKLTGTINPGTDNMAIKNASLNPDGWAVHLEADAKDKSGATITYVIDGKIENLAFHNRTITGTWKSQRGTGAFKIGRQ